MIDESEFNEKELALANGLVNQIDIFNQKLVLSYGTDPQSRLSTSSDKILKQLQRKTPQSLDVDVKSLLNELNSIKTGDFTMGSRMEICRRISAIVAVFRESQLVIMQDQDALNKLKKANNKCYKEISLYILAGQKRLAQIEKEQIRTSSALKIKTSRDLENERETSDAVNRFKRRLQNLEVSRNVALQTLAQITMLITTNDSMLERINTILNITIPLMQTHFSVQDISRARLSIINMQRAP